MDSDCPVCQCGLGTQTFTQVTGEDSDVSADVFRLKCGHAFHNTCLCRALRVENSCPVCRESTANEPDFTIVINGATIRIDAFDDVVQTEIDLETTREVSDILEKIRNKQKFQNMRAKLNDTKLRYRKIEAKIMKYRASVMRSALDDLRITYQSEYEGIKKQLRRQCRHLKTETLKAAEFVEMSAETKSILPDYLNLNIEDFVDNKDTFGPLKHRFWHH